MRAHGASASCLLSLAFLLLGSVTPARGQEPAAPTQKTPAPGKQEPAPSEQSPPSEQKPPESEHEPPESEQKPPESEQKPPESEQKPPESEQKPPESEQEPPASEQEPPESEQSPAEDEDRPSLRVGALNGDLTLDGVLSEPAWATAEAIANLVTVEPEEGGTPAGKTTVQVLADSKHIVFGVSCHDAEPGGIVSFSKARDSDLDAEDHVVLVLD